MTPQTTAGGRKPDYVYKNSDGEYFLSVMHKGELVLKNPSYPFVFRWGVQEPLQEIGEAKKFGHLVENKDYQFYEGDTLEVTVKDGELQIESETNDKI